MKYYFSNIKAIDIEKIKNMGIKQVIKKDKHYLLIFSLDGIFKIDNSSNKIFKLNYNDKPTKQIKINNYDVLQDLSEIKYNEVSQFPIKHFTKKIKEEVYMMRENASLKLIVLNDENEIMDFYFETNEDISNSFDMEDLAYFLSLF